MNVARSTDFASKTSKVPASAITVAGNEWREFFYLIAKDNIEELFDDVFCFNKN